MSTQTGNKDAPPAKAEKARKKMDVGGKCQRVGNRAGGDETKAERRNSATGDWTKSGDADGRGGDGEQRAENARRKFQPTRTTQRRIQNNPKGQKTSER